jgi:hypothetical protein
MAMALRWCILVLAGLVIFLCAPVRTVSMSHVPATPDTPLTVAVASVLSAPGAGSTDAATTRAAPRIDTLTARLIGGRARADLPRTLDLGAIRAVSTATPDPALRSAGMLGEHPDPMPRTAFGESVTGAAVAFGAPDAGRGGVGSSSVSTAGSAGSAMAMLSGLNELAVHDGFAVARDMTRSGLIHTSIQPLDRPG